MAGSPVAVSVCVDLEARDRYHRMASERAGVGQPAQRRRERDVCSVLPVVYAEPNSARRSVGPLATVRPQGVRHLCRRHTRVSAARSSGRAAACGAWAEAGETLSPKPQSLEL